MTFPSRRIAVRDSRRSLELPRARFDSSDWDQEDDMTTKTSETTLPDGYPTLAERFARYGAVGIASRIAEYVLTEPEKRDALKDARLKQWNEGR
jgi:hypothetical protein